MLDTLKAISHVSGERIDLDWTWVSAGSRPDLRLIRRTRAYSKNVDDGLVIIDLDDVFGTTSATWAENRRALFLGPNTKLESNQQLAEFSCYRRFQGEPEDASTLTPYRAIVGYYDSVSTNYLTVVFDNPLNVNFEVLENAQWRQVMRWRIVVDDGGTPKQAGVVLVFTGHLQGTLPDRFEWRPAGSANVSLHFVEYAEQHNLVRLEEGVNPDSGQWVRHVRIEDRALKPEEIYYYRLFHAPTGTYYKSEYNWLAEAASTGHYGLDEKLYGLVPAVHQYYDEPETESRGKGQLRRYLSLVGTGLDHIRSQAELLRHRHNVHHVYAKALPSLAKMIGWRPDITSDALSLRRDILDAPEIFRTVGTQSNLRSVVNRVTGWDSKIKEFVHNIFLTNAAEKIRLWEIWEQHHDGLNWSSPRSLTVTDYFDGHSLAVIDHNATAWMFWHSNREGRREIWCQRLESATPSPRKLILWSHPDQETHNDEYPTVIPLGDLLLMCWQANRDGYWNIWAAWSRSTEPFSTGPDISGINQNRPLNLTDYAANDRHPVLVYDGTSIWLFWQSDRRGKTDIWFRKFDGSVWALAERLTTAELHHTQPAAAKDDGNRVWLFWCDDRGDRINLYVSVFDSGAWTVPLPVTTGIFRDEAPSVVFWNGAMHLFWHSNRDNRWQVYTQVWQWDGSKPASIAAFQAVTSLPTADKEPFAMVDGSGNLRLLWRSQRRGREYQSRTIDTSDPKMIAELGQPQDRSHYTYDTRKTETSYYARDTIGVYLTPDSENPDLEDRNRRLFNGPLKEFIPINIRPVLFILPTVHREKIYTYDFPGTAPEDQRFIGEEYSRVSTRVTEEVYSGVSDIYSDTIPDWIWLRTWSVTFPDHHSVDFTDVPVDTHLRTWHIGLEEGE